MLRRTLPGSSAPTSLSPQDSRLNINIKFQNKWSANQMRYQLGDGVIPQLGDGDIRQAHGYANGTCWIAWSVSDSETFQISDILFGLLHLAVLRFEH